MLHYNSATDIRDINYTYGEQNEKDFKLITDLFYDNIMLVKITVSTDWK